MTRKFFFMMLLLLVPGWLLAQTTGKIRGTVMDRETGDALPGANVQIEGTTLGAATDVNGNYRIIRIPAGTYALTASFIGYQDVTVRNVEVNAGLTTELNFQLPSEAVEVGAVEIVAERGLVERSATNAVRIQTQEDIEKLPLRGLEQNFAIQAGVVRQSGNIHIRGGRADETGFVVEGATARNVMSGDNAVTIIPEAVEEFQVQAGGYNAEFGDANSGIISQNLRSGSSRYHVRFQAESDEWPGQDHGEEVLDTFTRGYQDYVLTLSGPIIKDRVKAFVALQRRHFDDDRRVFWSGIDMQRLTRDLVAEDPGLINHPNIERDEETGEIFLVDSGVRGGRQGERFPEYSTPEGFIDDFMNRQTLNASVDVDFNPLLLRFTTASTFQEQGVPSGDGVGARPFLTVLNQRRHGIAEESNNLYNWKTTYFASDNFLAEARFSYFDRKTKTIDPNFGDNYLEYGDSLEVDRVLGPEFSSSYQGIADDPEPFDIFNFPFARPGARAVAFTKQRQNYFDISGDFSLQLGNHDIKFGGGFRRWTIRRITPLGLEEQLQFLRQNPDLARAVRNGPSDPLFERAVFSFRRQGDINAFGYDPFGNEVDDDTRLFDGPQHPQFGNFYIQDKFEAGDLVINLGVRVDVFDFDQKVPISLTDPDFDLTNFDVPLDALFTPGSPTEIQPRVGFAFPVTDRTVFHAQYGRFAQAPQFNNVFSGRGFMALSFGAGNFINNPAVAKELEPVVTTQYELGFSHQLTDFASIDVTTFFRDVKGQVQIDLVQTDPGAAAGAFGIFENSDFEVTKGVELAVRMRRTKRISTQVNYTISDARGTGSFPNANVGTVNVNSPIATVIQPVDFNQRHRGSVVFDYRFGHGDGGPILQDLGVNLLFTFNSGRRYTLSGGGLGQQGPDLGGLLNNSDPRGREPLQPIGTSSTAWVSNLDIRVDKTIPFGPIDANFYFYVMNLFDTKNVLNVYSRTGSAEDDGFLGTPELSNEIIAGRTGGTPYVELYRIANLQNRQHQWLLNGFNNDLFDSPRQFRFGISLEY
ncbi:TonB-dependent receptor plug domain-containing protein [candidate division KSB1 bacterium]|nr:TonB-dependent receptor plug domain-containing protein [candidate division KSB1 bacterium]